MANKKVLAPVGNQINIEIEPVVKFNFKDLTELCLDYYENLVRTTNEKISKAKNEYDQNFDNFVIFVKNYLSTAKIPVYTYIPLFGNKEIEEYHKNVTYDVLSSFIKNVKEFHTNDYSVKVVTSGQAKDCKNYRKLLAFNNNDYGIAQHYIIIEIINPSFIKLISCVQQLMVTYNTKTRIKMIMIDKLKNKEINSSNAFDIVKQVAESMIISDNPDNLALQFLDSNKLLPAKL